MCSSQYLQIGSEGHEALGHFWGRVQLDVRDLGGHLDFNRRARAGTLSKSVGEATVGVAAVGALPLGFHFTLGLARGKYLPAGHRAAEASCVSSSAISAFRAATVRAVWSSEMPLANAPVILNLLDGPVGNDSAFHITWARFRMMRRYLAYCPSEEPRILRMPDLISHGSQGHGPVHLLLLSAAELGFAWDGAEQGWVRVSLPPLRMMFGPVQHFHSSILDAWRFSVFAKLSERKGFRRVEFADFQGSLQLLFSSHLRERDKMLLRAILCGRVPRRKKFLVDFAVRRIFSGSAPFPPFSMLGIFLRSLLLRLLIAANGLGVFFGMVGCLGLVVLVTRTLGLPLLMNLERCLGAYPVDHSGSWTPPEYWDADDIALEMSVHPNIWTDGCGEGFSSVGGFEVAVAGVYLPASELAFDFSVWGTAEEYGDARLERCRAFLPVPGVMQTVQRAEFRGAIVALQAYWPCHLVIDNLSVARTLGRLLDKDCLVKPLPMAKDSDFVALVQNMIRTRGRETGRVTRVKGHAEDVDVQQGRVRLEDQLGNAEADAAADLGRRHQSEVLIDAWRRVLKARSYWYPIMPDLRRFMIAVARVTVNHDGRGGTTPDLLVWDQGGRRGGARG